MSLRSTVIPVAGLGTRFLPATKIMPKELLPLVDRPLIQCAVEEAVAAGCERVVLVSSPHKSSVADHFRPAPQLEAALEQAGKLDLLELSRRASELATVEEVMQPRPLGVGHAILQAREAVGDEPFGVMFPDDFILAEVAVMEQLRRVHERFGGIVMAVEPVAPDRVDRYGIIAGDPLPDAPGVVRVRDLIEKPAVGEAPSDLGIVGRYVLPGTIFDILAATGAGVGGEIQLTDALRAAAADMPCHAVRFEGMRYDCGSKLGYAQATVELARRHPEIGAAFRRFLSRLEERSAARDD